MHRYKIILVLFALIFTKSNAQTITTIAGIGTFGYSGDGTPATLAQMSYPSTVAPDLLGNIYFSDKNNNVIRKIDKFGIITTVAGNGHGAAAFGVQSGGYSGDGGQATNAELWYPWGVAVDAIGNLYIADRVNNVVRKVDTFGIISTFAGNGYNAGIGFGGYSGDVGPATNAELDWPSGVAVDPAGNVFIADSYNNVIRKVNSAGIISTFAGNHSISSYSGDGGPATAAGISDPYGVAFDAHGNVYVGDRNHYTVRKIDSAGIITTFAGNGALGYAGDGGQATAATLGTVYGVATDYWGNVFISDVVHSVIRKVNTMGVISTYAGTATAGFDGNGAPATDYRLNWPLGIAIDFANNLYIGDDSNHMVRKIRPVPMEITEISCPQKVIGVNVFPNPNSGSFELYVRAMDVITVQIAITDVFGRIVYTGQIESNCEQKMHLNVTKGLYFVNVNHAAAAKLIIE